ncbi:MAG: (d)CMP kinase [Thermoanaerobaculia bacterium]|nr:(d)CMP kinase [Thermoanaerobaculia bacterium]
MSESNTQNDATIVAIDGPAGVGKSTVAQQLAKRLRLPMIDTGAMYRTVALKALLTDTDPDDGEAVSKIAESIELELRADPEGGVEVYLDGEAVGQRIRTPEVSEAASRVSVHSGVRRCMVELQRRAALRSGGVLEGRDIGTVVFPETPFKFFLTARAQVRAERRHRDLVAAGRGTSVDDVLKEILQRDRRDSERSDSPLRLDESYFEIDSSDLKPPEIVERMVGTIRRRQQELADPAESDDPDRDLSEE